MLLGCQMLEKLFYEKIDEAGKKENNSFAKSSIYPALS